jgi:thiamine-monophosphate kinase
VASGEDRLLAWLRRRLERGGHRLLGDDAAFLPAGERWAVSVDQQIEGVHYPIGLDPRVVGRRLVSVCLSDLAACGAQPAYGFLTVALPPDYPARRLLAAVADAGSRFELELAGGDVASTGTTATCALTVLGRRESGGHWLRRGAARAGDTLWLGATVGESALGRYLLQAGARLEGRGVELPAELAQSTRMARAARRAVRRHLEPEPQLELGKQLARRRRVAAIDVSDGLALDLHRLCRESGVGADIDERSLPLPDRLASWARRLGHLPLDLALAGGEDYVLLFTLPRGVTEAPTPACRRIGRITAGPGVRLLGADNTRTLPPSGWDHLTA